jgi:hypothetical protein
VCAVFVENQKQSALPSSPGRPLRLGWVTIFWCAHLKCGLGVSRVFLGVCLVRGCANTPNTNFGVRRGANTPKLPTIIPSTTAWKSDLELSSRENNTECR